MNFKFLTISPSIEDPGGIQGPIKRNKNVNLLHFHSRDRLGYRFLLLVDYPSSLNLINQAVRMEIHLESPTSCLACLWSSLRSKFF